MYCMLALSTPHCPGHTVYTHHTQPMQGPGGALRCMEVHWAIIVIRCTAYLEPASPPCPLPIRCSTVSEVRVYTYRLWPVDNVDNDEWAFMTRAMGACSTLAWNIFTTMLLVDGEQGILLSCSSQFDQQWKNPGITQEGASALEPYRPWMGGAFIH